MKLLQSYANSTSTEIKSKPYIHSKFFPLGELDKFITIQTKSGMPAKDYSHFQEVVNILKPVLDKQNIRIVHIGQDSPPLNNTVNLNNQTLIGQAFYILQKSLLHISVDSWTCHAACAEEIPCVAVYGSTTVKNHSPFHFNKDKTVFIESPRSGNKASFQRDENPKSIDEILPEQIAHAAAKLLNLDLEYPFETVLFGKVYSNKIIESACDSVINISALNIPNIIVRLDYNFNLEILHQQASVGKVSIVTDKIIPINLLQSIRPNIVELIYKIDLNSEANFCKELQEVKIPYRLYSELTEEELNTIKFNYINYNPISLKKYGKPEVLNKYSPETLFYKSGKFTLGRGKIYQSKWDYDNDRHVASFDAPPQPLIDINIDSLYKEEEYLLFLTKK